MEQGSAEWIAARCGSVGASRVAEIIAKGRGGGFSASRDSYMDEIIAERMTGSPADRYVSDAMRWGTEREDAARSLYSFIRDVDVEEIGLVRHPTIDGSHASPDGLVGGDGLIEIKCPNSATHLATIRRDTVPEKYVTQIHWQAACTRRTWCDFVSYDPRVEAKLQLFVKRIEIEPPLIAKLEVAVREFIFEVEFQVQWLKQLEEAA